MNVTHEKGPALRRSRAGILLNNQSVKYIESVSDTQGLLLEGALIPTSRQALALEGLDFLLPNTCDGRRLAESLVPMFQPSGPQICLRLCPGARIAAPQRPRLNSARRLFVVVEDAFGEGPAAFNRGTLHWICRNWSRGRHSLLALWTREELTILAERDSDYVRENYTYVAVITTTPEQQGAWSEYLQAKRGGAPDAE